MRVSRVHTDAPVTGRGTLTLDGTAANHIMRVLRLRPGDPLVLFDGGGGEYPATVAGFGRGTVQVEVASHQAVERESPLPVTLAQGVSRGERMDLVVQKATELGAARIIPVLAGRSVVRLQGAQLHSRLRHWRAVAAAACEQCGRNRLPEVTEPLPLARLLAQPPDELPAQLPTTPGAPAAGAGGEPPRLAETRLLLVPGGTLKVRDLRPVAGVTLLIGPEGGLTPAEQSQAEAAGFQRLSLGPRILRTETAALAALAAIQERLGDL